MFPRRHGHSLRSERDTTIGNILYVNPGAAGRHGFHQVKAGVRLTLETGTMKQAEVIHVDE